MVWAVDWGEHFLKRIQNLQIDILYLTKSVLKTWREGSEEMPFGRFPIWSLSYFLSIIYFLINPHPQLRTPLWSRVSNTLLKIFPHPQIWEVPYHCPFLCLLNFDASSFNPILRLVFLCSSSAFPKKKNDELWPHEHKEESRCHDSISNFLQIIAAIHLLLNYLKANTPPLIPSVLVP